MGNLIIIALILVFGFALIGIGVRLIRGQRRMERRQAVALAALRTAFGAPPDEPQPEPGRTSRPALVLYKGGAGALLALALLARRHWVRTVSAAAGALTATAVAVTLAVGHDPAVAGPPVAGQSASAGLTSATVPAAPSSSPSSSSPAPVVSASRIPVPSSAVAEPVVLTGEAPARPQPSATPPPSSSVPVPSRSPSAPSSPPHSPRPSITPPPSSSSAPCLIGVTVPSVLGVCLL